MQTDLISTEQGNRRNSVCCGKEGANLQRESRALVLLEFVILILIFSLCCVVSQRVKVQLTAVGLIMARCEQ